MKKVFTATLLLTLLISQAILTQASDNKYVKTELVSEVESIQPGQSFWVALHLTMDKGWHTYWKQAGDTGLATSIEWNLPEGFTVSPIYWPVPEKSVEEGIVSFTYKNEVLLLTQITPSLNLDLNKPITLSANVAWLACKESCIPGEAKLELTLPAKDSTPDFNAHWHPIFEKTRNDLPQTLTNWKVDANIDNGLYGLLIQPQDSEKPLKLPKSIQFFSYNSDLKLDEPQKLQELPNNSYFLSLPLANGLPEHLEGILINPKGWPPEGKVIALAIDIKGHKDNPIVTQNEATGSTTSLVRALLFAFFGGLILNLMPCVFPILGLKVMGFINYAGKSPWKARMHGLIFTLGILLSFWALSGLLLILRASGEHLGWGFQLQSPFFITFLCFLLLLLALNFLGTFEVGTSFISLGNKLNNKSGYTGTFSSGVLATVLATPCSAPFLGTAIGYTLAQPPIFSLIIFTAMAIGMSAPYLLLAIAPNLLKYLPRPGAWMETFKQAMAFPLFATVIWLLWVFGHQTHHDALTGLLFGLLLASIAAWIYGKFATFSASRKVKHSAQLISILFLVSGAILGYTSAKVDPNFPEAGLPPLKAGNLAWEKFSPEHLESLRADGRAVYIDFTAAWCVNCQINKKNVFSSEKVIEKFKEKNVALLLADWTRKNPEITKALQSYGRGAVPTNVYYPAGKDSEPIVLPELLTPNIVLEALK